MPWTAADADKHIKGLSSSQKSAWAKIANGALKSCMTTKKGQKFCEGYAIRVANNKAKAVGESDKVDIKTLPDTSFAFVEKDKKLFPYKDKDGKVVKELLKKAMQDAVISEYGTKAMPKLKRAAKEMKIGEYANNWQGGEGQFFGVIPISEAYFENNKPNDDKREIIIPLMKEGRGNKRDKNYYTRKAITEAASYLEHRKKMYLNHPKEADSERDVRDWAATVKETWTKEIPDSQMLAAWGRVKIHDSWLWKMAKEEPSEIATSVLGRGKAKRTTIEGEEMNLIESIEYINSCDFVDYPGNTPKGMVYFVESAMHDEKGNVIEDKKKLQEELDMDFKDLTTTILKEKAPELVAGIEQSAVDGKDKEIKDLQTKIDETEKENKDLKKKIDEAEVKEKLAEKKTLVEKLLKESDLPDEAKTDVFKGQLMDCQERKEGDKTITVEETMKVLIKDRSEVISGKGVKNMGETKKKDGEKIEEQDAVNEGIFGIEKKEEKKEEEKK